MIVVLFLLSLLFASRAEAVTEVPLSTAQWEDRVKGALIGSVFGDVLGRVTEPLGSSSNIKIKYGKEGISSLNQIDPCEWVYEPFKYKAAAYSSATVLALLTYKATIVGRKKSYTDEEITEQIARQMVDLFGPQKYSLDHHFSFRKHSQATLKAAEMLADCFDHDQKQWWIKQESKKNCKLSFDNESGALARAWPIGLIFADNSERIHSIAIHQTKLTHLHPTVLAASAALSVGVAASLRGIAPHQVVDEMITTAQRYEQAAQQYKQAKVTQVDLTQVKTSAQNPLITSDMLRYAQRVQGEDIVEVFGTGYLAHEALAAAAHIFLRYPDDIKSALTEAANAGGRTALIASVVGALVGARCGFEHVKDAFGTEIEMIENIEIFRKAADDFSELRNCECNSLARKSITGGVILGMFGLAGYFLYTLV